MGASLVPFVVLRSSSGLEKRANRQHVVAHLIWSEDFGTGCRGRGERCKGSEDVR